MNFVPMSRLDWFRKLCCIEDWNVGTIPLPAGGLKALIAAETLGAVEWWPQRRHVFIADPFMSSHAGTTSVLFEEFDYRTGLGRICSRPFAESANDAPTRLEIQKLHHCSYPFALRVGEQWFCVPECADSSDVDLYRWDQKAAGWQLHARLLDGVSVCDPTLTAVNGLWYMFGTLKDDDPDSKLRVWWAPALEGPWRSHQNNPARVAANVVRSAGALFEVDGRLYRPSQDSRRGYGSGIVLNRVDEISPTAYRETPVREWRPLPDSPYPDGMHTISVTENAVLVDGKRFRFTPLALAWKFYWRIRKSLVYSAQKPQHTRPDSTARANGGTLPPS